ncbi:MAG: acetylxylan esterase [Spirochaetaceae bacterium]|nr:MAG: acetylxylan esterase [Spirochaetaceae bacterium]
MPVFEMPLEELRRYQGINPKPEDFEEYWQRALGELKGRDEEIELIPAEFQSAAAECFDLYFSGVGGARIHAKYLRPKAAAKPHPALLLFHGYTMNSGNWQDKLSFVSQGFSVAALDCRGQGGLSEDKGGVVGPTQRGHIIRGLDDHSDKLLFRQIFLDTVQLARIVMGFEEVDAARVATHGGSQGGALSLVCASLEPRIKACSTAFPFLCDYRRVWEMDLAEGAYEELKIYFRLFDPTHAREQEIFRTLGYIDVQNLVPRIEADVLMGTALMDQICPPSTQFAAYNKIRSSKEMILYPDFGHEELPGFMDRVFAFLSRL